MKTPVQELFALLWDTPKDKDAWFTIRKQMMEKEKEALSTAFHTDRPSLYLYENGSAFEEWYNETFDNQKF